MEEPIDQEEFDELDELDELESEVQVKPPARRSILSVELPAAEATLREARTLAGDRNIRITTLARKASQDPVITLELLRVANATFFSADRPAISNVQTAVVRLGSQSIVELLDSLAERPTLDNQLVCNTFESLRMLARRTSVAARIIAQMTYNDINELAQTTGLMTHIGHLLACAYLNHVYAEEAQTRKRSGVVYRILQDHRIDINTIGLDYLRNNGIPNILFYGLDRDLKCKTPAQSALRFIVESAVELVDAHKDGRWDKYDPRKPLPGKSALRLLKMNSMQYEHIYDTIEAYLTKPDAVTEEEEERREAIEQEFEGLDHEPQLQVSDDILPGYCAEDISSEESPSEATPVVIKRDSFNRNGRRRTPTLILTKQGWGGYDATAQPTTFLEASEESLEQETESLSEDAVKVLNLMDYLCRESEDSQALLNKIMKLLISDGPFVRAALLVLSVHRRLADIHTAVGQGFVQRDSIEVKDPLSPLALCLTKIKSFNSKNYEDLLAPFGISAYAVSPVKIKHDAPVVLYADCGLSKPLPMESRRIFRLVVGLLNRTLPRLSGGLPKKAIRQPGDTRVFEKRRD